MMISKNLSINPSFPSEKHEMGQTHEEYVIQECLNPGPESRPESTALIHPER